MKKKQRKQQKTQRKPHRKQKTLKKQRKQNLNPTKLSIFLKYTKYKNGDGDVGVNLQIINRGTNLILFGGILFDQITTCARAYTRKKGNLNSVLI